ncbi:MULTISPECIES: inorganic phosphate transporter [Methylobacterium]|uniref:Phosphate transporter n=1 Tax=Methylobacterium thuringiense TaxID=1003091 RepID=A0ABQ4TT69_9HYPH|nr:MULTISPECIES: inorganic phosphate transporter [Methylobacterium]TXN23214.1 inorganic phosphate transporter [Methylobacterium sp. WL9]GJE57128.1 Low-affinity inorganic phosphate transporter 1 [Methylobacterium thuringiense]
MSDAIAAGSSHARQPAQSKGGPRLDHGIHPGGVIVFLLILIAGLGYAVVSLIADMNAVGESPLAVGAFALLGLALLIALGFEFVNGFHDTANAVATVIYTHSMPPLVAVVWSGTFNFLGVMLSSGAVAYAIVTLLPVELILQVGSGAGYAMIFSLLIAAILWNLGTWALGLPNSSSHALIGSVLGVGLANQLMGGGDGTSGVDWAQAFKVFQALLFSPLIGFVAAALLLLALKYTVRNKTLYEAPKGEAPPPLLIRGLLILTCTLVSFFHGGNDGQKGMGLIMLILIGAAPTAYALNRTMSDETTPAFIEKSQGASAVFASHADGLSASTDAAAARKVVGDALKTKHLNTPDVFAALATLSNDIAASVKNYGSIRQVPAAATSNVRNDMYLASDAVRLLPASGATLSDADKGTLKTYANLLNEGTRFIPSWVKVCVALALGLGTMVGWKRIVVTVGEKIGKTHLTYAQGASAELVAAGTIGLAEVYGLPVSTTHILSSGVAGTMAANGSGLQASTVRNMALAWVLTLPAAITLAGGLFFILRHVF